jgi:hypothetical protein
MGSVRVIRERGTVTGYRCDYSHKHGSSEDAVKCNPEEYAKAQTLLNKEQEKNRRTAIADSKDFDDAVFAAEQLGADPDDLEEVVLKNGCEKVLAVRDQVKGLGIPKPKTAAEKKAAAPQPPPPPPLPAPEPFKKGG